MKSYITTELSEIAANLAANHTTLDEAASQIGAAIISISGDYRGLILPDVILYSTAGGTAWNIARPVLDEFGEWRTDFLGRIEEGEINDDGEWVGDDENVIEHARSTFDLPSTARGYEN